MADKEEWRSHREYNGRLNAMQDWRDGELANPHKKDTPEWMGYEAEKVRILGMIDRLADEAGRLGV